jgi:hypothetical protein
MAIDLLNVSNSLGSLKFTLIGSTDGRQDNSIEAFKRITFVQIKNTMSPRLQEQRNGRDREEKNPRE